MSICESKVNDFVCEVPKKRKGFTNFKGSHIYDLPFPNVCYFAKRNSGKTVTLFNAVKELMRPETHVIMVSSTVDAPDNYYVDLQKILKQKKMNYSKYDSVFKEKGGNIFKDFIGHLKNKTPIPPNVVVSKKKQKKGCRKINNPKDIEDPVCQMMLGKKKKKGKKKDEEKKDTSKYTLPYIFCLDDLSEPELRCPDLDMFIRMARHFRAVLLLSTQSVVNLPRKSRSQYDYIHIYKGMDDDRLEQIYKMFQNNCSIDEEMFYNVYHYICGDPKTYDFMLMDRNGNIRKNFNTKINF